MLYTFTRTFTFMYSKVESFLSDKNFINHFDHGKFVDNYAKCIYNQYVINVSSTF